MLYMMSLRYQIQVSVYNIFYLEGMNKSQTSDFLDEFTHLKTQWKQISTQDSIPTFQHTFSNDFSQLRTLPAVSMKDLDLYSSREAYCYPFCPRVYKYSIANNNYLASELTFDIKVLIEKVSRRIDESFLLSASNQQIKLLRERLPQIIRTFDYLYRRFGQFHISANMIGWTELGMVKIWFNQDFASNQPSQKSTSQQEMVQELRDILEVNSLLHNKQLQNATTFDGMFKALTSSHQRKQSQLIKHVAFKPIQNFSGTVSEFDWQSKNDESRCSKSRKNITFSYSNKDLADKMGYTRSINHAKRSSIKIDNDEPLYAAVKKLSINSGASVEAFRLSVGNVQNAREAEKSSSLKMIVPPVYSNKLEKKLSAFKPYGNDQRMECKKDDNLKLKKLSEHFSKTTLSSYNSKEVPLFQSIPPQAEMFRSPSGQNCSTLRSTTQKTQILHYSTSSNPYSKFINIGPKTDAMECESYKCNASADSQELQKKQSKQNQSPSQIQPSTLQRELMAQLANLQFDTKQMDKSQPQELLQKDQVPQMRASQEIKEDLQALFNSDHNFDYNELENQLDSVLF